MAGNRIRFLADLNDKVSSQLDKIRDKFNTIGGKGTAASLFGNLGAKAAGAALALVGTVASNAADFIGDSISAASDLNETLSKSRVVFGNNAREIEAWGKTAAQRFGTSQEAAVAAAASFADLFKTVGLGAAPSKNMSKSLVELSADLASFHNIAGGSPEVLEKLRSGLSGEAEPMRRLGVFLSETKVRAKAMQLGLAGAHGELTEGEKIIARYNIILDETKTAQGDFARTSDQLANRQRIANALLEDQQAVLGEKLLPAQLAVTNAKIDLITGLTALGDKLSGKVTPEAIALSVALGQMSMESARSAMAALQARDAAEDQAEAYTAYETNRGKWITASSALAEALPDAMRDARDSAVVIAANTPQRMATALLDRRTAWQDAWETYKDILAGEMEKGAEIAKLKAILASKRLAEGLRSEDPVVRAAAVALRATVTGEIAILEGEAAQWGKLVGTQYAKGLRGTWRQVAAAAAYLAKAAANNLEVRSPAKEGPLSRGGPEAWGARAASLWAVGMADGVGFVRDAASRLAGAAVPNLALPSNHRLPTASGGGSPVVLQLVLPDGRVLAELVDRHLTYSRSYQPR